MDSTEPIPATRVSTGMVSQWTAVGRTCPAPVTSTCSCIEAAVP